MITLKKLNGTDIVINAELIETIEAAPDTVINLVTGNRFIVKDSVKDVIAKVTEYRKTVYSGKEAVNPIEGLQRDLL
ncbi:MAG: flagellar FlbD family protein [Elusimicrobia bacterium]|nr:flagellar FlbD family protein [Elusimicrobiota bacterium]